MSAGDWALIVLAVFWAVLVVFLALVLVQLVRVLESTKILIDGIRSETVPLLGEVTTSVKGVNRELDRVDDIVVSAASITKSAERLTSVVERAISSPLVKAIAFGAGASRAFRRLRGS
ncbi:MAG TPA: DUF948 domain-containing protein [Actinomycetota bacterium]